MKKRTFFLSFVSGIVTVGILVCAVFTLYRTAFAHHGMPGTYANDHDHLALNGTVIVHSSNGVSWIIARLEKLNPRLVSGGHIVPLKVIQSFDDLEGSTLPFQSEIGYGDSLKILKPTQKLQPNKVYKLMVTIPPKLARGDPDIDLGTWKTINVVDRERFRLRKRPTIATKEVLHDELNKIKVPQIRIFLKKTKVPDYGTRAHVFLDVIPRKGGTRKHMHVEVEFKKNRRKSCKFAYLLQRFEKQAGPHRVKITLFDESGNRTIVKGKGLPIMWPPGKAGETLIHVCVEIP